MARGSMAWRRLTEYHDQSRDAFDQNLARNTKNELDIASQYTFSPERVRLFRDGTRQFVQYNQGSITGFTDAAKTWDLAPAEGETLHIESAESASYVVNFELLASLAFQLSRDLQDGDVFLAGARTADDGWYIEQRGADHTPTQVDVKQLDGGTESTLQADIDIYTDLTAAQRWECSYNWYGVGSQRWRQTFTETPTEGDDRHFQRQRNMFIAETADVGEFSTESGNVNVWYEITRGAGNDAITLHGGSMSLITLGDTASLTRSKPQPVSVSLPSTNDTWLPVYALRLDPDHPNVNARMRSLDILSYGNNTFLELVAASFSPDKTDASGWSLPEYHHDANSAFQDTTTVSEVADDGGTQKTLTASDKFGGFTLASSAIESGGNTLSTQGDLSSATEAKKSILASDEIVFLARTGNAGATLRFTWAADQDW